ncbi:MAG: LysR family transcriptional regulator [Methylotenera sp.]|uniref:LysR family transcriptional regulator n=1 Tax=Methylotenera sp. TaxID=2051956 RepID=UPI002719D7F8|nr:LysR family transcriptional regulator [Methylotenera sp.]MDO9151758.1 LysR family transcriptional regulator [Methylotenera sp.]
MSKLNYHHLNYFWHVAKIGNLTKAAEILHVSQSALSVQIRQLEESVGKQLFTRQNRKLILTDTGNITFSYAESIFNIGDELEALLKKGLPSESQVLRIGMLSTMSRNFVEDFINPLMNNPKVKLNIAARGQTNLLNDLANHQFDLALTNIEVRGTNKQMWQCQLLVQQPICVIGQSGLQLSQQFNQNYKSVDWILPTSGTPTRSAFDGFCAQHQFQPNIVGEADDMAMLRLLARDSKALAVMPDVVVKDEISAGSLTSYMTLPNIYENFYVVTVKKHLTNHLVSDLIKHYTSAERI